MKAPTTHLALTVVCPNAGELAVQAAVFDDGQNFGWVDQVSASFVWGDLTDDEGAISDAIVEKITALEHARSFQWGRACGAHEREDTHADRLS